jgi:four helix bundle protein
LNLEVWRSTVHLTGRDRQFCDQLRDAADSTERNVSEGFGRFNPAEIARFLDFSRASVLETRSLLKKGLAVGHLSRDVYERLDGLALRAIQVIARWQRYLRSPHARRNAKGRYRR